MLLASLAATQTRAVVSLVDNPVHFRDAALEMFHVKRLRVGITPGSPACWLTTETSVTQGGFENEVGTLAMFHVKHIHAPRQELLTL